MRAPRGSFTVNVRLPRNAVVMVSLLERWHYMLMLFQSIIIIIIIINKKLFLFTNEKW